MPATLMTINFQKTILSKVFKTFTSYYMIDFSFEVSVFSKMKK
jgi:hypothetical protein